MSVPPEVSSAWGPSGRLRAAQGAAAQIRVRTRADRRSCAGDAGRQAMTRENDAAAVAGGAAMEAPPCAMVIFGAAGDLTKRLVVPALYDLFGAKHLPERFQLVGVDLA